MMLLELGSGFREWLKSSQVASDKVWSGDVVLSEVQISAYYSRQTLVGNRAQAIESIERLQNAVIAYGAKIGCIPPSFAALIAHVTPLARKNLSEFLSVLGSLPLSNRQALLFSLILQVEPNRVCNVTWSKASEHYGRHDLVDEILMRRSKCRHSKLPYVFWEPVNEHVVGPIESLAEKVSESFGGANWPTVQLMFDNLILDDSEEGVEIFMKSIGDRK